MGKDFNKYTKNIEDTVQETRKLVADTRK